MAHDRIYFTKPLMASRAFQCCLKIINDQGDEFSLAMDNSAGAHDIAWRGDIQVFGSDSVGELVSKPIIDPTPVQFLERLATHLGYTLTKWIAP